MPGNDAVGIVGANRAFNTNDSGHRQGRRDIGGAGFDTFTVTVSDGQGGVTPVSVR